MATADQIKSLIRTHYSNQREQFSTIALQVAAHEAMQGHQSVALEIRSLVDGAKVKDYDRIVPFTPELEHLVRLGKAEVRMSQLVVSDVLAASIKRILTEYRQRAKLERFGMSYRRKILLAGPPGTGKTMTASVLASELQLPLYVIQLDKIVTKFMGETSAKLRLVFEGMRDRKGVYLFDEFDTIGGERAKDNDVGEMRRVLNSFLQFIENDPSDSLIVCATNNPKLLDQALFRRFDDVLSYELPDVDSAKKLIRNRLANFISSRFGFAKIGEATVGMSH
ncbi:MAG: AAA family ATPase, partial [Kiritimatiellae bacterium]|nr:AAA family ATPase [Kiritimatiellia bacterium]